MPRRCSKLARAVLVVDDEALVRIAAEAIVADAGFIAIGASNADEAVHCLETHADICALFTDIHMPGSMDGLGLARLVSLRWPNVALLVTSGRAFVDESELPKGGQFVPKPYSARRIEAALHTLICID